MLHSPLKTSTNEQNFRDNSTLRDDDGIDGLVQERRNSSALAMELRLSCTNPSTWKRFLPIRWGDGRADNAGIDVYLDVT